MPDEELRRQRGALLKQHIEAAGFTQEKFAEMAGIQERTLKRYLAGDTSPDREDLAKMADALNISVDELLGRSPLTEEALTAEERELIVMVRRGWTVEAMQTLLNISKGFLDGSEHPEELAQN